MTGDALAKLERDAVRMVDEKAHEVSSDDLREQDLHVGLHLCQAGLDIGLDLAHVTSSFNKKAGSSPASQSGLPAAKSLCVQVSSVSRLRGLARAIPVDPVVMPLGVHGRRERERLARLGSPAELQQRA